MLTCSRECILLAKLEGNLEEFFRHENKSFPPSLTDCTGRLRLGDKSSLPTCIVDSFELDISEPGTIDAVILDGADMVPMLQPGTTKNFDEYAEQIIMPYIHSRLKTLE